MRISYILIGLFFSSLQMTGCKAKFNFNHSAETKNRSDHKPSLSPRSSPTEDPQETAVERPGNLIANAGNQIIDLTWSAANGVDGYHIFLSTSANNTSASELVYVLGVTSYQITGLNNGTTYYVYLRAEKSSVLSKASAEVNATPFVPTPSPETPAYLAATTGESGQVTLNWPAVSGSPTGYKIYRSTTAESASAGILVGTVSSTTFTDTTVTNGTAYYYVVKAYNGGGLSNPSLEMEARPWSPGAAFDNSFVWVDAAASCPCTGSYASPFDTISNAIAAAANNATVVVRDGTYSISATVTVSKPLTIRSISGHYLHSAAILQRSGVASFSPIRIDTNIDDVTLLGLEITSFHSTSDTSGVFTSNEGVDRFRIIYNYVHGNSAPGIAKSEGDGDPEQDWLIFGNFIDGTGSNSDHDIIKFYESNGTQIINNTFSNSDFYGINMLGATNLTIKNNTLTNINRSAIILGDDPGIDVPSGSTTVENNTVSVTNIDGNVSNAAFRIKAMSTTNAGIEIKGNSVSDFKIAGIRIESGSNANSFQIEANSILSPTSGTTNHVSFSGSGTLDISGNWWGDALGPFDATYNPAGAPGITITGPVNFTPFLTAAPL